MFVKEEWLYQYALLEQPKSISKWVMLIIVFLTVYSSHDVLLSYR